MLAGTLCCLMYFAMYTLYINDFDDYPMHGIEFNNWNTHARLLSVYSQFT